MRVGIAAMRAVTSAHRGVQSRGFFWIFKGSEISRLQSQLSQPQSPLATAQTHISLAKLYLKEAKIPEALPHAQASFSLLSSTALSDTANLSLAHQASRLLMETLTLTGQAKEALQAAETCEQQARKLFGVEGEELARSLFGVSYVLAKNGNDEAACRLCEEVVDITRTLTDHTFLADALSSLGQYYARMNKRTEALATLAEALELLEATHSFKLTSSLHLLRGDLLLARDQLVPAAQDLERALELMLKYEPKRFEQISSCYELLLTVSMKLGKFDAAKKCITAKIKLDQKALPADSGMHPANLRILGIIELEMGNATVARASLEKALAGLRDNSQDRVRTLNILCKTCIYLKDFASASQYADRMLSDAPIMPPGELPQIHLEYGIFKSQSGDAAAAFAGFTQAIQLDAASPSDCGAFAYMNLGHWYSEKGDFVTAVSTFEKGCALLESLGKGETLDMVEALDYLAIVESKGKKWEAAEQTFRRSLSLKEKLNQGNSDSAFQTRKTLAKILIQSKKFADAESLLTGAIASASEPHKTELSALLASIPKTSS